MKRLFKPAAVGVVAAFLAATCGQGADVQSEVRAQVDQAYAQLFELYKDLHSHPELSFQEEKSSARLAEELRKAGVEVTTKIGQWGVAGALRNGAGPTILVRSDMDALPVREQTGLAYASTVTAHDPQGMTVAVMHACGHDVHMTCLAGTARVLAGLKDHWHGTILFIGQPAEELGGGASAMLKDGLYKKFPRPDFCLALHDSAEIPAGTIGYTPGYAMANVDSVDILVHGVGGHGAYPHKTKDPVVLAARIVLALQTIVSREMEPVEPAVVTVGSIHGGTKHNIISDQVRLQLTVRSFSDKARQQILEAIKRIVHGEALAAGMPQDAMPEVTVEEDFTRSTYNDPQLTERLVKVFGTWFGPAAVLLRKPSMGGEDFGEFGRVEPPIPICMFNVGGVDPAKSAESEKSGKPLPSLHSPLWAPVPEPTIKTGIIAMSAAVLELAGEQSSPGK